MIKYVSASYMYTIQNTVKYLAISRNSANGSITIQINQIEIESVARAII